MKLIKKILINPIFVLFVVLVLGFVVRLYKIGNPIADWHSWRQADTASVSKSFATFGIDLLRPRYHDISSIQTGKDNPNGWRMVEFPIFNLFHVVVSRALSGISFEEAGRLTSILCSLVSALFIFLLGKKYLGVWLGVLASFFFLAIPYNIYFSRVILPEPLAVTFGLVSIYFFSRFLDKDSLTFLVFSALFMALSLLVKPFTIFYLFPMVFLALEKYPFKKIVTHKKLLARVTLFASIAFFPLFIWRSWITNFPEGIPFFQWAFNGDRIRFHPAFWNWIFIQRLAKMFLGGWGIIIFISAFIGKKINKFVFWFILGMVAYVVVVATANVKHDYYQILTMPAISFVLTVGFEKLFKKTKLLSVILVSLMLFYGWGQIEGFYRINHPEIMEVGRIIDNITPRDALIVAPYNGDTAFLYQTNRWGWPAIDSSIDEIIAKGADYYVSVTPNDVDSTTFKKRFATVLKSEQYLILDLHHELDTVKNK